MKLFVSFITASLFLILCITNVHACPKPKKHFGLYISYYENVLGTSMELKVSAASEKEAAIAENAALNEIRRMAKILSAYDANSEFSKWLRTSQTHIHISPELFEVLDLFDKWKIRTDGALDASAEVINKLWKQAASQNRIPTKEELINAVAEVRQPHWKLDATTQTAVHFGDAPLMLNSFVKSYIIKHAADAALHAGKIDAILVNIGGDMVVSGNMDERIQISNPKADAENETPIDELMINNKAVATSGNYRRGELILGRWYSHIVDPRTGQPADDILSATVVAASATDAGALATAFNVMRPSESIKLASSMPGVEFMIITRTGSRITSHGWNSLEAPVRQQAKISPITTRKDIGKPESSNEFELEINLAINLQKEGFVKRPYVAIWAEDENHAPVRTICLWHGSNRYLPELKSWYLKYRERYTTDNNFSSSVTSATRSAGKYTVKWDGKDDEGNFVKPGKYTIKIEASREHGTYQLMRQEIEFDEKPKQMNLTGNIEISSASMDYRKKTNSN